MYTQVSMMQVGIQGFLLLRLVEDVGAITYTGKKSIFIDLFLHQMDIVMYLMTKIA